MSNETHEEIIDLLIRPFVILGRPNRACDYEIYPRELEELKRAFEKRHVIDERPESNGNGANFFLQRWLNKNREAIYDVTTSGDGPKFALIRQRRKGGALIERPKPSKSAEDRQTQTAQIIAKAIVADIRKRISHSGYQILHGNETVFNAAVTDPAIKTIGFELIGSALTKVFPEILRSCGETGDLTRAVLRPHVRASLESRVKWVRQLSQKTNGLILAQAQVIFGPLYSGSEHGAIFDDLISGIPFKRPDGTYELHYIAGLHEFLPGVKGDALIEFVKARRKRTEELLQQHDEKHIAELLERVSIPQPL